MSKKLTQEERNKIIEEMYEEFSDVLIPDDDEEKGLDFEENEVRQHGGSDND